MKKLIGMLLIAGSVFFLSACETEVVATRPAEVVYTRPEAPGPEYVWIDGDWAWEGGAYHWHEGHWDRHDPNRNWRKGHWEAHRGGWRWQKGRWE